MRSAIIAAAFAATVIAVPLEGRAVVTDTDVKWVYTTDIVTVTRQGAAATTQDANQGQWGGGNHHWWGGGHRHHKHKHTKQPQPTESAQPTESSAPAYSAPPATSETWAAPTTKTRPAPTKKTSAAPAPTDGGYEATALYHHNQHRKNHTSPDIQWDAGLVSTAKKIAESCKYAHNTDMDGGGYGQNIAAGVKGENIDQIISNMFYDSEVNYFANNYGNPNPPNFEEWGHFSQMVWINTQSVGCYTQYCPGGLAETGSNVPPYFTVCNYKPPGNVAGGYADNIKKPVGMAPLYAS